RQADQRRGHRQGQGRRCQRDRRGDAGRFQTRRSPQLTALIEHKESWSMRRYMITGFVTVFVLVFGLGAWSLFTQIAGAVVGIGVVEVETKRQVVQHATGGVVGKILATDGQRVEAGETLLVFDDT